MNPSGGDRLSYNRELLVDDVDSRQVVNKLIARGVLDVDDDEEIRAEKTRKEKTELLLHKIANRGPDAYKHFREALGDSYQHIVVKLDATPLDAGSHRGDAFLHRGGNVDMQFAARDRESTSSCEVIGNKNIVIMGSQGANINFAEGRKPQDYM